MNRHAVRTFLTMLATLGLARAAAAQTSIFFGGGATIPSGEYGDYAKTGWIGAAGVGIPLPNSKVSVVIWGAYGSNNHDDDTGDKTNIYSGNGGLEYRFGDPAKAGIYVNGSVGFLVHSFKAGESQSDADESETKIAFSFGGGPVIPAGKIVIWGWGGYVLATDTNFLGFLAGIGIPLGGGGN